MLSAVAAQAQTVRRPTKTMRVHKYPRLWLVCNLLLSALVVQPAPAQESSPRPVKVRRGMFQVECQYGPADSARNGIALTFGTDVVAAQEGVERALRRGHLRIKRAQVAMWTLAPVDRWPQGPLGDPWRAYPHPGVFADLILGMRGDSVVVLGVTQALCASSPGAPDSTVAIARQLVTDSITSVLTRGRPH
ncbi:hypothetical protein YTPLAS18_40450 [Nitrospira sp.]|nr:hypothetical protein YTPLAS18_40450 [Nitrospira sp.]